MSFEIRLDSSDAASEPFFVEDCREPVHVNLKWRDGDVALETGDQIAVYADDENDPPTVEHVDGGVLRIRPPEASSRPRRFGPFSFGAGGMSDLRVVVPAGSSVHFAASGGSDVCVAGEWGNVEGSTAGGDVSVDGVGEVSVRTAGGDVEVERAHGVIRVSTSGGDVHLADAAHGVHVSTAGGDVVMDRAIPPLEVRTAGGDVKVRRLGGSGDVRVATAGGDVRVRVEPGIKVWTDVKAGPGGDLENCLSPRGEAAEGEPFLRLEARTIGGDITLEDVAEG